MKNFNYFLSTLDKKEKLWVHSEVLFKAIGILFYDHIELPEIECFFHQKVTWRCTDTYVGLRFYFLNGECVCVSYQSGRKYDEQFEFVSNGAIDKLRKYLIQKYTEFLAEQEKELTIVDKNEDWSVFEKLPN